MITLFNYWHFIVLGTIFFTFLGGVFFAFKQGNKKLITPIIISFSLISILVAGFSVVTIDKYTKVAKLYKLENKRMLSIEKIIFSGVVKNEGNHMIGKVVFEIKLVNKGRATGKAVTNSFFSPNSFMDFFSGSYNRLNKPQQVTKEFVVAKNLRPGESRMFRVYFDYPPYFRDVSHFTKLYAH